MQLSLPLTLGVEYGQGNFVISSCNYEAYRAVTAPHWYNGRVLIIGERGCGKTHLASIWAKANEAIFINRNFQFDVGANFVLEDIEKYCSDDGEEFLFHLINHCQLNNFKLLFTANSFPKFMLKDLRSRIQATQHFMIGLPDIELIKFIMLKQFADRQLDVPFNVIEYASKFLPRDFTSIQRFITKIDELSLSKKRNITLPLIKDYFNQEHQDHQLRMQQAEVKASGVALGYHDLQNLLEDEPITA